MRKRGSCCFVAQKKSDCHKNAKINKNRVFITHIALQMSYYHIIYRARCQHVCNTHVYTYYFHIYLPLYKIATYIPTHTYIYIANSYIQYISSFTRLSPFSSTSLRGLKSNLFLTNAFRATDTKLSTFVNFDSQCSVQRRCCKRDCFIRSTHHCCCFCYRLLWESFANQAKCIFTESN